MTKHEVATTIEPRGEGHFETARPYGAAGIRFPLWTEKLGRVLAKTLEKLPARLGYNDKDFNAAWQIAFIPRFLTAIRDYALFDKKDREINASKGELAETRAEAAEILFDAGGPLPEELSDLGVKQVQESVAILAEELESGNGGQAASAGEHRSVKVSHLVLGVPMIAVTIQMLGIGWSIPAFLATIALSAVMCGTYAVGIKGWLDSYYQIFGQRPSNLSPRGLWLLFIFATIALSALTWMWVKLDARFIVQATALDRWGDASPLAVQTREAVAMAGVFTTMLLISTTAVINLRESEKQARRAPQQAMARLRKRLAKPVAAMGLLEMKIDMDEAVFTEERKKELYASHQAAWYELLRIIVKMLQKTDQVELIRSLDPGASAPTANHPCVGCRPVELNKGVRAGGWFNRRLGR